MGKLHRQPFFLEQSKLCFCDVTLDLSRSNLLGYRTGRSVKSSEKYSNMSDRPRPVTATVTKPRWMQIPDPDTRAKLRNQSMNSHGSDESLISLLDKVNTYTSENETEDDYNTKESTSEESISKTISVDKENVDVKHPKKIDKGNISDDTSRDVSPIKSVSNRSI